MIDKRGALVTINGAMGEGGGQILRTSLALSLCSGKPFRIINLRSRRKKPGFRHQHLVCANAAAKIGGARIEGATLGSQELIFTPTTINLVITIFGERGVRAETVADKAAKAALRYLDAGVPVCDHLADQLLLPFALAGGGSYNSLKPTPHTRTNSEVLKLFMDIGISMDRISKDIWQITLIS